MNDTVIGQPRPLDADTLAPILALYDQGLYLQAYRAARGLGPVETWRGAAGRVMAGRLALTLGHRRLGRALHRLAWREHPDNPDALLYAAHAVHAQRGPWAAQQLLRDRDAVFDGATAARRADWLALRAYIAANLRDFNEAERRLAQAEALDPSSAWIQVERAAVCEQTDDYDGALAATERALALRPGYRPAVEQRAHVLRLLNRDDEALATLAEASLLLESASTAAALLELQMERALYKEAQATLERIETLSPLADKIHNQWLAGRRADLFYHLGDRAAAASEAKLAGDGFYRRLAERLEQPPADDRRVQLPVEFVRQHHMTCAPATLSAIARYWQQPAEHLSIAEAICYDGTPDQAERNWAEQSGWRVREFTVTWDAAVKLLERGLPFTLTTVDPGNAHMQAIIGYDSLRGTFLIRDPYHRQTDEFAAEPMLERYAATGPRGMLMVPAAETARLDGLDLPDAGFYDDYYGVQSALLRHDRPRAAELVADMAGRAPEHRMTLFAQRSLANYDSDEAGRLRVTDALLAQYPTDVNLRLARQSLLFKLGRREQCQTYLAEQCDGPDTHPLLCLSYAELLRDDARELDHAQWLLRRALRQMPLKAEVYFKLAHVLWDRGRREPALDMYRTAAALEITDERFADSYFKAARFLGHTDAALEFLEQRFQRWGRKSAQPAMTLFEALDMLEQTRRGLDVLEQALEWRPQDSELMLYCADAWLRNGAPRRAEELLTRAEPLARRATWLQTKARLAETGGRLAEALAGWEQVAQDDPFNIRAVRAVARLRADTAGPAAATAYLEQLVERFPHHHGLNRLYVEWLDDQPPAVIEAALRKVLAINPADAWSWRELALKLDQQQRLPEAFEALAQARALAPRDVDYHTTHARLLADSGRDEEAREALREALRLSVDSDYAIHDLLRRCRNVEERRAELAFILAELVRQVTFGDGLLSYQEAARNVLAPQDLLATLRAGREQRADLWHAWVALARQLRDLGETDEALGVITEAAERFPLLPRVWLEMAHVERRRANPAGQETALRQALQISPAWGLATRALAELYQGQGRFNDARELLGQALRHNPRDGVLHGWLADVLWLLDEYEPALDHLEQALRLEPGYLWAWDMLTRRARDRNQPLRALQLARNLTVTRPSDGRAWLLLARASEELPDALDAIRHALKLDPRSLRAHELRVDLQLRAGNYNAALDATQDEVWRGNPPPSLRLRRARILARRGDQDAAVATVESLLAAEPDYIEAWEQLADWHAEADRKPEYLAAARELVRLNPGEHSAHGYVADALLRSDDRVGAKLALRRALELDPSYGWALNRLFDLELEDQEVDAATRTLALIDTHAATDVAAVAALRLASAQQQRDRAVAAFEKLAASDGGDSALFDQAVAVFKDADELGELDTLLLRLIEQPGVNPQIGRLWAERCSANRRWRRCRGKLETLLALGAIGLRAAEVYLRELARSRNRWALPRFLRNQGARLRADIETWGLAGYALLTVGLNRDCARWMHDWREREDIQPWMLLNLSLALRDLGRLLEAQTVSQHAVELGIDDAMSQHRILLAIDAGIVADVLTLEQMLAEIGEPEVGAYYAYLLELARALIAAFRPDDPSQAMSKARHHLRRGVALLPNYRSETFLALAHRRAVWQIATTRSRFWPLTALWFLWLL